MASCPYSETWRADLDAWVVHDIESSRTILNDTRFRVRPPGQAVPPHLENTLLGKQFSYWIRQRDDSDALASKAALVAAFASLSQGDVAKHARQQAALAYPGGWHHWAWVTPVATTAALLGLPLDCLDAQRGLFLSMQAIALGLRGENMIDADLACGTLLSSLALADGPLQRCLNQYAPLRYWLNQEDFAANRLALLWQSYEAGAALLSNAVQKLSAHSALRIAEQIGNSLDTLINEGGAVLNTKRYSSDVPSTEYGREAHAATLVLDLRGGLGFGAGHHQCPGKAAALHQIATALGWLIDQHPIIWPHTVETLSLPNARIPLFANEEGALCSL